MSKIKDAIKGRTSQEVYYFGDDVVQISGKKFTRYITVVYGDPIICVTMKIVLIPFTEKAICTDIWFTSSDAKFKFYAIKNQIRPCTLDDIEDWINKHFQEG